MRRLAFLCKSNPRPVHNVTTFFTPELAREIGLDNARLLHDAVSIPAWSIDWVLNTCAQNNEVLSRRQRRIKGPDDDNSCDLFVAHEEFLTKLLPVGYKIHFSSSSSSKILCNNPFVAYAKSVKIHVECVDKFLINKTSANNVNPKCRTSLFCFPSSSLSYLLRMR